jgi:hypothetical protein
MVVLGALLVAFATLLTAHVVIAVRLVVSAHPRYRGLVALFFPPVAPMWAYRERWTRLAYLWIGAAVVYTVMLVVASFVA